MKTLAQVNTSIDMVDTHLHEMTRQIIQVSRINTIVHAIGFFFVFWYFSVLVVVVVVVELWHL